jgi:hypothetical protein
MILPSSESEKPLALGLEYRLQAGFSVTKRETTKSPPEGGTLSTCTVGLKCASRREFV